MFCTLYTVQVKVVFSIVPGKIPKEAEEVVEAGEVAVSASVSIELALISMLPKGAALPMWT